MSARFGQFWRCSIPTTRAVAITDGMLIGRIETMEKQGFRVAEIPDAFMDGMSGLAIVRVEDPEVPVVMVPMRPHLSETDLLRVLLRAYDLDQMPIEGMRH